MNNGRTSSEFSSESRVQALSTKQICLFLRPSVYPGLPSAPLRAIITWLFIVCLLNRCLHRPRKPLRELDRIRPLSVTRSGTEEARVTVLSGTQHGGLPLNWVVHARNSGPSQWSPPWRHDPTLLAWVSPFLLSSWGQQGVTGRMCAGHLCPAKESNPGGEAMSS